MIRRHFIVIAALLVIFTGCFSVKYSFSGADTGAAETCSVQYFPNRAPIVNAGLSQQFTDALKDKIQNQTDLTLVNGTGDVDFEGAITGFSTQPTAVQSDDVAAQNRFTIQIRVKFTNVVDPDLSYETSFSRYQDYPSTISFEEAQTQYMEELIDLIIEDIFNKAFVNW
ncbi:MAG: LptE family protein [Bacteroidota bacterium]